MGIFKKSKAGLSDEQKKLDRLWELWAEGRAASPCAELMTYQSEVGNGGHDQYFLNVSNAGNLQREMAVLNTVLPARLKSNLQDAYKAYLMLDENETAAENALEHCDQVLDDSNADIERMLKAYASKLEL